MNTFYETAPGKQRGWNLIKKVGEGDAGEVYQVESIIDHIQGVLKRPKRGSFPSDLIRQAAQIEKEAGLLAALSSIDSPAQTVHVPALLDISRLGTEYSERFFIIITPAPGINLEQMLHRIHFNRSAEGYAPDFSDENLSSAERFLLDSWIKHNSIPDLVLLRTINGILEYFEMIHAREFSDLKGSYQGVLWNDVKLNHIYYDPNNQRVTLIDWGNSQFLNSDGVSQDRQHSRSGDYLQFLTEFGSLLAAVAPHLLTALNWPESTISPNIISNAIRPIKEAASKLLLEGISIRNKVRRTEADLIQTAQVSLDQISQMQGTQQAIIDLGEIPDYKGTDRLFQSLGKNLYDKGDYNTLTGVLALASQTPLLDSNRYLLLQDLSVKTSVGELQSSILKDALDGDWLSAHWDLRYAALESSENDSWVDLSSRIRHLIIGEEVIRPYVAVNRLAHALKLTPTSEDSDSIVSGLIAELTNNILPRWLQLEPDPPNSGIEYKELDNPLSLASQFAPDVVQSIVPLIDQARTQAQIAVDAWLNQDFALAHKAMLRMLLWDPDRIRVFKADQALKIAEVWLDEISSGLRPDEPLQDFVTRQELIGRDLRNHFAAAPWLDQLLEAFKQLRKGTDPTDVLVEIPETRPYLGWLVSLEPRRPLLGSRDKLLHIDRNELPFQVRATTSGVSNFPLGQPKGIQLFEPLDVWAPEARGSSARLFTGSLYTPDAKTKAAAIKIIRPDQIEYALPLFHEEVHILSHLADVIGVIPMLECGFIRLQGSSLPDEKTGGSAESLKGEVIRYGLDSIHNFLTDLEPLTADGWLVYLGLEKFERNDNLLLRCDTGYTNGKFLPTLDGLVMAIQICDILEAAHSRGIIYRDHKILHYYWIEKVNGIFMIDWNVAKRYPAGLSTLEVQFDLVQFGARALHYILAGRAAPGALPMGPNRPEEIEAAAHSYQTQWTYDDQRLPKDIKDLLKAVLSGAYFSARSLREDLTEIYEKLSMLV